MVNPEPIDKVLMTAEAARKETNDAITKVINGAINKIVDEVNETARQCKFIARICLTAEEELVNKRIIDLLNKSGYGTSYEDGESDYQGRKSAVITIDWQ